MPESTVENRRDDSLLAEQQIQWNAFYRIGAVAALCSVFFGLLEIAITFTPGGSVVPVTVLDWFKLYQDNPFIGLRDLGLINFFINSLGVVIFFSLYAVFRRDRLQPYALFAVIILFIGTAVFYATNRAFTMLALSQQYAAAASDAERALVAAAGLSALSVGRSHSPGTFFGFFICEIAGIMMTVIMLKSQLFSKATAVVGLVGWSMLMFHELLRSFAPGIGEVTMMVAIPGGLCIMAWYILIAVRLLQFGRKEAR
jgi:hypothetical protein